MVDDPEPAPAAAFILSGPITIATVHATRERMLACLRGDMRVAIHAAEVTQLDGAGAQLLYAFIAEVARRRGDAHWISASIYLVEAASMLGMASCLGLSGLPAEATSWRP